MPRKKNPSVPARKEWLGDTRCDFCGKECGKELYDARTRFRAWAVMDSECFAKCGVGLGTGYGQRYEKDEKSGKYFKVEG